YQNEKKPKGIYLNGSFGSSSLQAVNAMAGKSIAISKKSFLIFSIIIDFIVKSKRARIFVQKYDIFSY
ncbi:hypothetical protein, partial [uncultured Duncaniella sp.]|uniref:hypothetical protein n=1 Tax=uncultured Duncaniella sp. TaxID=2768039 RepID=UPI0026E335CB